MTDATEGEGTWTRLTRRKVVQWGIAYAAGAWGFLQGLQYVGDAFGWPSQLRQVAILALLIGLPVALVVAWYHGDRGEQRVTATELTILTLLFLLGGGIFWRYERAAETASVPVATTTGRPQAVTADADSRPSVAVLPFVNLSTDPANEFLADGIADSLLTMLVQVHGLKVIGRTSSFAYKGKNDDLRTIGAQLGVTSLLEGSVQRVADRLRVTVQLVNAKDGTHLWAETYDRSTTDIFALQDEIARRVTEALAVALAGKYGPASIGTTNLVAYEAYLRGRQLSDRRQTSTATQAIDWLTKSVTLDPQFARAWAALSLLYSANAEAPGDIHRADGIPFEEATALAERAARRAIAISPDLGIAHAALAAHLLGTDKPGAMDAAARAFSLSPADPQCLRIYSRVLQWVGNQPSQAARIMRQAIAVEPQDLPLRLEAALALDAVGDQAGALRQYQAAIRIDPTSAETYDRVARLLGLIIGQRDASIRFLRRAKSLDPENVLTITGLRNAYSLLGESRLANEELIALRKFGADSEVRIALARDARLSGLTEEARAMFYALLAESPRNSRALYALGLLRSTPDQAKEALTKVLNAYPETLAKADDLGVDLSVCLLAWSGDGAKARDLLAQWEPVLRQRVTFSLTSRARFADLARSLACTGRGEDAVKELEVLLQDGYGIYGWRNLDIDPAYDGIRHKSGFKAAVARLKSANDGELQRFHAHPDLTEADIEALGNWPPTYPINPQRR